MNRDPLQIVGQVVADKYRIDALVGEGGFASVYRAVHTIWNKPVAIKFFSGLSTAPAEQRDALQHAFIQEGALLTELSSATAGIVQARDVGAYTTPSGQWVPYLVLEWLQGASLETVLQTERQAAQPPWSVEEMLWFLHRVLPALDVAHQRGVAHRDVKPANLFVLGSDARLPQTTIKILDFGVAKLVENEHLQAALAKTGVGISSFTPQYGAPEQFTRSFGATGPWTDVYAIALVAVELLRGREALDGKDMIQLGFASANLAARPTPRRLGLLVSDAVEAMFERALSVDPRARHASAAELLDDVQQLLGAPRSTLASSPSLHRTPIDHSGQFDGTLLAVPAAVAAPQVAVTPRHPTTSGSVSTSTAQPPVPKKERSGWGSLLLAALVATSALGAFIYVETQGNPDDAKRALETLSESAKSAAAQLEARVESIPLPTLRPKSTPAPTASTAPSSSSAVVAPDDAPAEPSLECPSGMELVRSGEFSMGSNDNTADPSEKPAHPVHLSAYCLDKVEVTAQQFTQCVAAGKCARPAPVVRAKGVDALTSRAHQKECTFGNPDKLNHPVNCINWHQATAFCRAVGKRLPSEAEWEYAARGTRRASFVWGNEEPTPGHLNACGGECTAWAKLNRLTLSSLYDLDDAYATTAPVGAHPKGRSEFGIDDLAGNVWEWVNDYHAPYQAGAQRDPSGPDRGKQRVLRGGGWDTSYSSRLRPSYREASLATSASAAIGFRCAKTPTQ